MLRDNQSPEIISKYTEQPLEYIYQIQHQMLQEVHEENQYGKREQTSEEG